MGTLALDAVTKSYGAMEVLHGLDLEVAEGEFVALVGPSGCGKSTLLRMIAGLEAVTSGEIRMDGRRVNEVEPARRGVAMVFQSYALYPHMSVRQNMAFSLEMEGVPRPERTRRVAAAARVLDLADLLDRRPRELSGGQMQRVAMGRAMVRDPAIFLFDEPLSNLDAQLRGQVRGELQALHRRLGTTTIHVTHDQVEAMTLASRVVVMREGRIEQVGTPLDLYDRPETPFVAGFIGTPPMNLIEGVWDGTVLVADGLRLPFAGVAASEGATVTIGVRPQHLARTERGWPATVTARETTGHETHVTADLAPGRALVFTLTDRDLPAIGAPVALAPLPGAIHVFQDGRRLR